MAKKKTVNDTQRQIRLPSELSQAVDEVLEKLNLSFSEAVRIFLDEMVKTGKLPFRPTMSEEAKDKIAQRKKESDYVDSILGINKRTAEERLLQTLFDEVPGDAMSDGQLLEWGKDTGLPSGLTISTLEDLYNSGLFARHPWWGGINANYRNLDTNSDARTALMIEQVECIKENLENTHRTLLNNALSVYLQEACKEVNENE